MKTPRLVLVALAALWIQGAAFVGAAELGSEAPPLALSQWVKGDAVTLAEGRGTNLFVVEFWATWCPPCAKSIPRLSEIQQEFREQGVIVIGISDEEPRVVSRYVEGMGDQMNYRVAIDEDRETSARYRGAFGVNGVPHAFIVDREGRVVWHGHTLNRLEIVLKSVIAGTYTPRTALEREQLREQVMEYLLSVSRGLDNEETKDLGKLVVESGDDEPDLMNQFAWIILTDDRIRVRHLDLAMKAAQLAYDATEGKDAAIADTLARAHFDTGNRDEAIRLQTQAVELCTDPEELKEIKDTLKRYLTAPGSLSKP